MQRRTYLRQTAGLTALAMGALAGCTADQSGTASPEPTATSKTPTTSGPLTVTPTGTSFEVKDRSCGEGTNTATVTVDGETIRVNGVIGGSDTCDTARLGRVEIREQRLTVVVQTVPEETTETPACGQCLTDITYGFETTLPGTRPDVVKVVHESGQGTEVVAEKAVE